MTQATHRQQVQKMRPIQEIQAMHEVQEIHMPEGDTEKPRAYRAYNRVKMLRRDSGHDGLSRKDLAEAVGISPATLGNIEREEHEPGVLLAWRIAGYFGLPLEAVFSPEPIPSLSQTLRALYPCSPSEHNEHREHNEHSGHGEHNNHTTDREEDQS